MHKYTYMYVNRCAMLYLLLLYFLPAPLTIPSFGFKINAFHFEFSYRIMLRCTHLFAYDLYCDNVVSMLTTILIKINNWQPSQLPRYERTVKIVKICVVNLYKRAKKTLFSSKIGLQAVSTHRLPITDCHC